MLSAYPNLRQIWDSEIQSKKSELTSRALYRSRAGFGPEINRIVKKCTRVLLLLVAAVAAAEYPLHEAARTNNAEELKSLAATLAPAVLVPALDEVCQCGGSAGLTPLSCAGAVGAPEAIAQLVELGATVDFAPKDGQMSALHWAAARGRADSVGALLAAGAS